MLGLLSAAARPRPDQRARPALQGLEFNLVCVCAAGFYIIPRSPTEVYYDVSTEAVEAQLYNWFYCCNSTSNANCPASAQAFHSLNPTPSEGNFRPKP